MRGTGQENGALFSPHSIHTSQCSNEYPRATAVGLGGAVWESTLPFFVHTSQVRTLFLTAICTRPPGTLEPGITAQATGLNGTGPHSPRHWLFMDSIFTGTL